MSNKGWFNLEAAGGAMPETQFFEGDSAFKFLSLTRTQRLYGFVGWWVTWYTWHTFRTLLTCIAWSLASYWVFWEAHCSSWDNRIASQVSGFIFILLDMLCTSLPVLYAMGTIISLAGTGFLIGVCIIYIWKEGRIFWCVPALQFFNQIKLVGFVWQNFINSII